MEGQGPSLGHVVGKQIHSLAPQVPTMWPAPSGGCTVSKINPACPWAAVGLAWEPHRKPSNTRARGGNCAKCFEGLEEHCWCSETLGR